MSDELYQARIVALAKSKRVPASYRADQVGAARQPAVRRPGDDRRQVDDGKIAEIAHQVRGCLLCQASAAALASTAVGRDAAGVAELATTPSARSAVIRQGARPFDAFEPVANHKSRHECVLLPFEALKDALS